MAMLQDEIKELGSFFRGIEYFNDALIVKVSFPERWQVYPSMDNAIKPARSDNGQGEYYYYGDMNKVSLDDIFGLIKETITANQDAEMKIHLLNEKIEELKELFRSTAYDNLVNLKFTFEKKKQDKAKKKATTRKTKVKEAPVEEEKVEEPITEEKTEDKE